MIESFILWVLLIIAGAGLVCVFLDMMCEMWKGNIQMTKEYLEYRKWKKGQKK